MTDVTRHWTKTCATNHYWTRDVQSDSGNNYTVRYEETPKGPYQFDYTCTCRAFKYGEKGKHCKHIDSVSAERCAWNVNMDLVGDVDECPQCGGPLESHEIAT